MFNSTPCSKLKILTTWAHESISHVWRNTSTGEVVTPDKFFTHGVLITWHASYACAVLCKWRVIKCKWFAGVGQNISQICYCRKQSHVDCQSALLVRKPQLNHHYHTPPITLNSCNINYHGDVSLKSNILQLIHSCAPLAHSMHCSTLNTHSLHIECVASHKEGNPSGVPVHHGTDIMHFGCPIFLGKLLT